MVKKSKLQWALADEKGTDFNKIKEKNRVKALHREKAKKQGGKEPVEEVEDEEAGGDEGIGGLDIEAMDDSDTSDSEVEMEERILRPKGTARPSTKIAKVAKVVAKVAKPAESEDEDDEEDDEEDIPVSDLEDLEEEDKEDLIPHTRLTINNTAALLASLERIRIPTDSSATFASHQSLVSATTTADDIPNVSDDLHRELQFYKQSRDAALKARALLRKEKVPFSRPVDVSSSFQKALSMTVSIAFANQRSY